MPEQDMAELDTLDKTNGTDRALERKWWWATGLVVTSDWHCALADTSAALPYDDGGDAAAGRVPQQPEKAAS
jgi:hypothetical protein